MLDFDTAKRLFRQESFMTSSSDPDWNYFLKLRSMSRRDDLEKLADNANLDISNVRSRDLFEFIYNARIGIEVIETTINEIYEQDRMARRDIEDNLISELYRLNVFDWGGLYQNSLERTIVDNYVKKITSFNEINEKIENELHHSMKGYVLCSWYNHWTSIIIEDIFKDHRIVLPAVGLVKKIDFFVKDVPFDLKVTYLPEGYISEIRRYRNLRPELSELRRVARALSIPFNPRMPNSKLLEDLWKKVEDHPNEIAQSCIHNLQGQRIDILNESSTNPEILIKWLYENQGTRRFDANYRLFLVLVKRDNFFDSWKLKRAKPLLVQEINLYLDSKVDTSIGREVNFLWQGQEYNTISDAIFITS